MLLPLRVAYGTLFLWWTPKNSVLTTAEEQFNSSRGGVVASYSNFGIGLPTLLLYFVWFSLLLYFVVVFGTVDACTFAKLASFDICTHACCMLACWQRLWQVVGWLSIGPRVASRHGTRGHVC